MIQEAFSIANRLGLHARAAARLVRTASKFKSDVKISRVDTNQVADGKSILELLMLAVQPGTEINISVDGDDEEEALIAIRRLITNRFEEG